uniref:Uncharacterized protein n=1 Tax=viral metagenome TaxID=1070528 RepID=A0A6M3IS72_9ZZZZ
MRYYFKGLFRDGSGHPVLGGTASVYLAGTTTAASVYAASSGGVAVNSVTSSSTDGTFEFYVDESDYGYGQKFKVTLSKSGYTSQSYDNLEILKLPWTTSAGVPKFWTYQADALADLTSVNLPDATSGILLFSCNAECGLFLIQTNGTPTKVVGTTNTGTTDSGTVVAVLDIGTGASIKNRLGATGEIRAFYVYN